MPSATWSNYLWVRKQDVPYSSFAALWEHEIPLLRTPEGRSQQNAIKLLRMQARRDDLDPDSVAKLIPENAKLTVKNWTETKDWWALCGGDKRKVQAFTRKHGLTIKDKRVHVPWPEDVAERLRLEMTPREYQIAPFEAWMRADHGIFHAAPAFGKTFVFIWSILQRKQATLVLVHADVLAEQLIERFREGSPASYGEADYLRVTNCLDVERELGVPIIGRYRSPDELYPVTVATWQSFTSDAGHKALKAISKRFGYVLCDEAHYFGSPAPAAVLNGLHARWKGGVTATPKRKDNFHVALFDVLGPVTATGTAPQVPVTATFIPTGCTYTPPAVSTEADWAKLLNWLVAQPDRNALIAKWAIKDVRDGATVLVLSERVKWCFTMAAALTQCGVEARAVVGGLNKAAKKRRRQTFQDMMDGKVRVVFATSTVKAGLDVPIIDTIYAASPMNNEAGLEQALGRGRRPYEGKQRLQFRYFADNGDDVLRGCAVGTQQQLVRAGHEIILLGESPEAQTAPFEQKAVKPRRGLARAVTKRPEVMHALYNGMRS